MRLAAPAPSATACRPSHSKSIPLSRISQRSCRCVAAAAQVDSSDSAPSTPITSCSAPSQLPCSRRGLMTAALVGLSLASSSGSAVAADMPTPSSTGTIYFGNGCFWGRQHDFVEAEKALGRAPEQVSAVVGYGAGSSVGPGGRVCYYYSDPRTVYEKLGHAEVVQLDLSSQSEQAEREFRKFAQTYFRQFNKTPFGMARQDPQDAGAGYRNVVGLPGGIDSPLFKILQEENVNGMKLLKGEGQKQEDKLNTIWIIDSNERPFYRAEQWHQFHDGLGYGFPDSYKKVLKGEVLKTGRIGPTGCPEYPLL